MNRSRLLPENIGCAHFVILYDVFVIYFIFVRCSSSSLSPLLVGEDLIWGDIICRAFSIAKGSRESSNHRVFALNMYGSCLVFCFSFWLSFIVDIAKRQFRKSALTLSVRCDRIGDVAISIYSFHLYSYCTVSFTILVPFYC